MPSRLLPPTAVMPDGTALHLEHWPTREPAMGTVLLVHGLGEHIGRHHRLASRLSSMGWHVAATDQRGHGLSPGGRGQLPRDEALLEDLAGVIDIARAAMPTPLLILGHSMGGLVAARLVAGGLTEGPRPPWYRPVDGLVLSSPALDAGLGPVRRLQLALMRRLAPDLALHNGLRPEWISRDPAVVRAYVEDPLVHDRITPRLAGFIVDGGALVRSVAARWNVPTLLMWSAADRCVAARGSEAFAAAAPAGAVTGEAFREHFHEIFNDPDQRGVQECLAGWLERYV